MADTRMMESQWVRSQEYWICSNTAVVDIFDEMSRSWAKHITTLPSLTPSKASFANEQTFPAKENKECFRCRDRNLYLLHSLYQTCFCLEI